MITRQQACDLFKYDFKLVDKEGKEHSISGVHDVLMLKNNIWVEFNQIGIDFFILAHHHSCLTKQINGVIPIVELSKMALMKVFRMLTYEDCVMNNVTYQDTDFGIMIKFEHHNSYYKFIVEAEEKSSRYGFYFIRDNDIKYYLNQPVLFDKLHSLGFLPHGIEESNVKYIND